MCGIRDFFFPLTRVRREGASLLVLFSSSSLSFLHRRAFFFFFHLSVLCRNVGWNFV